MKKPINSIIVLIICLFTFVPQVVLANNTVEEAISKIYSTSKNERMQGIRVLTQTNTARSTEGLISAIHNPDDKVRYLAVYELSNRAQQGPNTARATEGLISAINSSDDDIRLTAVKGLANVRNSRAVEGLIHALDVPDLKVQNMAVEALVEKTGDSTCSERATEGLIHALDNINTGIRLTAAKGLANLNSARAKEGLKKALQDPDPDVRKIARQYQ
jgi:HEAT repeat protein